jgi:RND family efflux transporter MFP subunit
MELNMRFLLTLLLVIGSSPVFAIDLDGRIDFAQRLDLNSSVSARVQSINVAVGQQVAQGELLLTLGTTPLQAGADMARAEADALAPRLENMTIELEKAQELFDRDSLALVELQQAEQNFAIAQAKLKAAQARLVRAEYLLSQTEIRAPISGIVLAIEAGPGQYINTRVSDQTLITIADNRSMIATALLPLEQWHQNLLNRKARVSYGEQNFDGRVLAIGHQLTSGDNNHPATTLQVKFDARGKLPAGLTVKISVAGD